MTHLLTDSAGQPILLGSQLGAGGEGIVYEIAGRKDVVAKIYKQPMTNERADKIRLMTALYTVALSKMTAWPLELLLDRGVEARGLLMPRVSGYKEIHDLYGPKSRRVKFPKADFKFLVHVAGNVARAFATVHASEVVIGDVNPGGVFVAEDGTVKLIDCDSFQINNGNAVYCCEVGVPMFTPPELHDRPFRGLLRTPDHDNFGLAVLIFHLLFMGRHPFSGRYRDGDMPIEKAIKEHRFAYGVNRSQFKMEPPPNMPAMSLASSDIASFFERAFAPTAGNKGCRPTANDWVQVTESLSRRLKTCQVNGAHAYLNTLANCPWCEIEVRTGATLFNFSWSPDAQNTLVDVEVIWAAIRGTTIPPLPPLLNEKDLGQLQPSSAASAAAEVAKSASNAEAEWKIEQTKVDEAEKVLNRVKLRIGILKGRNWEAMPMTVLVIGSILSLSYFARSEVLVSTIIAVVSVFIALFTWNINRDRKFELKRLEPIEKATQEAAAKADYMARLSAEKFKLASARYDQAKSEIEAALATAKSRHGNAVANYKQLESDRLAAIARFEQWRQEFQALYLNYKSLPSQRQKAIQSLLSNRRTEQLEEYLDRFYIVKANIKGLSPNLEATLASYNIETAGDVVESKVLAVPGFGPVRTERLVDWRKSKERGFQFNPTQGVDPAKVSALDKKILMERRKLEQVLSGGANEIVQTVREFEKKFAALKSNNVETVRALAQAKVDKQLVQKI